MAGPNSVPRSGRIPWPGTLLLVAVLAPCAATPAGAQPGPHPEPDRVRAELGAVCQRLQASDNPYFGARAALVLESRLAGAGSAGERISILGPLGLELLRLGRLDEAVERLESALALVDQIPPEARGWVRTRLQQSLGLIHLQRAEDRNCLGMRTPASCILPILPEAVHMHPEDAGRAAEYFQATLGGTGDGAAAPEHARIAARWLLGIARMLDGSYPESVPPELRLPEGALSSPEPFPRWIDVAGPLGVAGEPGLSGGAVMDDLDGDGHLDLVSTSWDPCAPMRAYRGDGRGGFQEVSGTWALDSQLGGLNLVHADHDGDGDLDLLVLRGAWMGEDGRIRNSLLRNDLDAAAGRFVDVTAAAGLAYPAYPTQTAAWADYDGDGDLDLYVGNEASTQSTRPSTLSTHTGRPYPSQLFRNRGPGPEMGTFENVTRAAGVENLRFAKGVTWGDYDGDGDPDLYVSNIGANRLYRNRGDGTFEDVASGLGVTSPEDSSFATWFFDHDQDGDLDIYAGRYSAPVDMVLASYLGEEVPAGYAPVVYRNDRDAAGTGGFTDVSAELGLTRPLLPMGANFGDLDGDGFPDLHLGTGVPDFHAVMPNVTYRNAPGGPPETGGRRFVDVTFAGGFGNLQKGHGVAFGDFDRDGDQDLFQQLGGAFPYDDSPNALMENPGFDHAWIGVRLAGTRANRAALGARLRARVRAGDELRTVHAVVGSGGSFGGSSLVQTVGLGDADDLLSLAVAWPGSGTRQRFEGLEPGRYYWIEETPLTSTED
jgi:hypothetical protein